ncbi:hypothetical protein VTN77DRAFT_1567 [Rasamsonia byssochlamydoides]|uniref:uncharacterized protein n=1 Tax=Rasamsonia byssochlamydoides TaxID=89139 RepID=UPI003742E264
MRRRSQRSMPRLTNQKMAATIVDVDQLGDRDSFLNISARTALGSVGGHGSLGALNGARRGSGRSWIRVWLEELLTGFSDGSKREPPRAFPALSLSQTLPCPLRSPGTGAGTGPAHQPSIKPQAPSPKAAMPRSIV